METTISSQSTQAQEEDRKEEQAQEEDIVSAFNIQAASEKGVDYDKLLVKFGCFSMTQEMEGKIGKLTEQVPHRFIRRGIFFCHRDFDVILNRYEQGKLFYLYTGRGPSAEALHLGHAIPFIINNYLQQAFDVPLVIQITDDEKYLYRPELDFETVQKMAISNIKDIIAFGYNPEKVFIFMDSRYIKHLYPNTIKVQKNTTMNQIKGAFGFNENDPIGKFAYPPIQSVPSFCNTFPHIYGKRTDVPSLIPCAIDQDPYFRMTRDVAVKLKYQKTASYYSIFFPALQGLKAKMSSSDSNSSILLTDTPEDIRRKITLYAFTGVREDGTANLDIDVPFQYLRFFFEDDVKLEEIRQKYSTGEMKVDEVKEILIQCLTDFTQQFQERRKKITDEDVQKFMEVRKINPEPKRFEVIRIAKQEAERIAKEQDEAKKKAEEEAKAAQQ